MRRALAILCVAVSCAAVREPVRAQPSAQCGREEVACFHELYEQECLEAPKFERCLVFLQRLETTRQGSPSVDLALLLGETLTGLSRKDELAPEAQARYLARARAAYGQAVRRAPSNAAGYIGLAALARTGKERVQRLRGAVRAEYQPAHMARGNAVGGSLRISAALA